jgi:tRNA A-37 threonylcarbamoyl transferase component Bud32/tetratricopeptide (TPR) repeat protein
MPSPKPEAIVRQGGTPGYTIGGVVARGGMGEILDARQEAIDRTVAMKVMLDHTDATDVRRFIDEAKITGQLDHPNIVPIYELAVDEQGRPFYTMKMVRGITLKKVLELVAQGVEATAKKYPLPTLLTVFQKVCDALAFAHSRRVIHRDLKPENIMLGDFGSVLVMDWGLAKLTEPAGEPMPVDSSIILARPPASADATACGTVMGTPAYMAPEQARGEARALDPRADIYALGAILFEILHLRPAVCGADAAEVMARVARGEVEWSRERERRIPESLLAVCRKALAFEPAERYAQVEDLQRDLTAYQNGFATSAENAGVARQLRLLLRRHKTVSIAAGLFIFILPIFTLSVLFQARRAEREAARANAALADLRRTAPSLLSLAESKARLQRFDSALENLRDALALDPEFFPANWRRAWIFLGQEKFANAACEIRAVVAKDRRPHPAAAILPLLDELAAAPAEQRWTGDRGVRLLKYLEDVGASGEMIAISKKLQLSSAENLRLVRRRIGEWLGGDPGRWVRSDRAGSIEIAINNTGIDTLEPLRGLAISSLRAVATNASDLEPLRGMQLTGVEIFGTKVADLEPLRGMPLHKLTVGETRVRDLSPVKGAPLEEINCSSLHVADFSFLAAAPLLKADLPDNDASDLHFLAAAPVEELNASRNLIADLEPLRGKPLRKLLLSGNRITDLSPLRGAPIEMLEINGNPIKDISPALDLPQLERLRLPRLGKAVEPLRNHPALKFIAVENEAYEPVAVFWAEFDRGAR